MKNQQIKIIGSVLISIVVSYLIGKNSNPAKVEVKTIVQEKIVYVESTKKAVASKKVSSSTTKPDGTKVEKIEETFALSESSQVNLDSSKVSKSETTIKNSVLGLYLGAGVRTEHLLSTPYLSGVLTYNYLAFTAQSDLKLDHRIAGHIGINF